MRSIVAALVLAACATPLERPPDERVAGCWISRDSGAVTMRWLPDAAQPGVLRGIRREYRDGGAVSEGSYSLAPVAGGFTLCELHPEREAAIPCWQVAQGETGSLDGGRAFIDAHADRLRIAVFGAGAERVIFQGRRDTCD